MSTCIDTAEARAQPREENAASDEMNLQARETEMETE